MKKIFSARVLAIETSGPVCGIACLAVDGKPADFARVLKEGAWVERERAEESARHSEAVFGLLDDVLKAARIPIGGIDAVAVSLGPGSFTGLRVGLAVAKVLAIFGGKALVGVPTLEAQAAEKSLSAPASLYAATADAKRGELYVALYRRTRYGMAKVRGPWVSAPEDLERVLPPGVCRADSPPKAIVVAALGAIAFQGGKRDDPDRLVPVYVRRPEAVERLRRGLLKRAG